MTLLWLAYGAGLLSVLNPCGFALLPAFLTLYTDASPSNRLARGLAVGLVVSAGFAAVYTAAGLLLALGLRPLLTVVPWLAVALIAGRQLGIRLHTNKFTRDGGGLRAAASFGLGYAVASLSCTLAILLSVVTQALTAGDAASVVAVFVAYAAGATTLLLVLSLAAALASAGLARALRRFSRYTNRIAGALLAASGLYLIAYWAPALRTGRPNATLAETAGELTAWLSRIINAHLATVALAALLIVAAAAAVLVRRRSRTASSRRG
jgi:cytochrome c biogenesis protein CcdA